MLDTMELSLEIGGRDDKTVYLPPKEHAHRVAVTALSMGAVWQFTMAGNTSILTGFVLESFPMLYSIPGWLFDPYVHDDHGKRNTQGHLLPWSPSGYDLRSDLSDKIIKGALALLFHVIRKPQQNLMSQITRRFIALFAATVWPKFAATNC